MNDKNFDKYKLNGANLPEYVTYGAFKEIINENFDLSWFKNNYIKHETIANSEKNQGIIDDGSVNYYYNSNSFRCDEFKTDHNKTHILFAGCSQTEGIGGNVEDSWPMMILNNMKNDNSGFYNIARSGYGWEMIIHNAMIYFDKYGTPDYMFVLLPNITRNFKWNNLNKNDYAYIQQYLNANDENNLIAIPEYFESLFRFLIGWRLFMSYCFNSNIKLYWSTWYYEDIYNLSKLNILNSKHSNFVFLSRENESKYVAEQYANNNKPKYGITKRDGHSGILINQYWADEFIKQIRKDNENF